MRVYFISVEYLKRYAEIDDNVDDKTCANAIWQAQERLIQPVIGTNLYNKLKAGIYAKVLDTQYFNLLINYIWKIIWEAAPYFIALHLQFRMTDSAVVVDSNTNANSITDQELFVLKNEFESAYKFHIDMLKRYINANSDLFPEYYTSDVEDLPPSRNENAADIYYDGPDFDYLGPSSRP